VSKQHTNTFGVAINGLPVPDHIASLLTEAQVEESLNLPAAFSLRYRDPGRKVLEDLKVKIGSTLFIHVNHGEGRALIAGEVTALEAEHVGGDSHAVVRGRDYCHRLQRDRRTFSYRNMTYGDIAREIAKRASLDVGEIEDPGDVHEHVAQFNQTDWYFLTGLAREVGYEISTLSGRLDFRPQRKVAGLGGALGSLIYPKPELAGGALRSFHVQVNSAQLASMFLAQGWDISTKQVVSAEFAAQASNAKISVTPYELANRFGSSLATAADVPYRTQAEVDAAAEAFAEQVSSSFAELEGVADGDAKLRAGQTVTLKDVGKPFDGDWVLTSVRHVYEPAGDGYTTEFAVSGAQERSLFGLASGGKSNGRAGPPADPIHGVATAIVRHVDDPEKMGRVKLAFPWLSDSYESDWARVAQLDAGPLPRGACFLPEVKDEVLVSFDRGDFRHPIVIGSLFNGKDKPGLSDVVDSSTGSVTHRWIAGHSTMLWFEDSPKEQQASLLAHRYESGRSSPVAEVRVDAKDAEAKLLAVGNTFIWGEKGVLVGSKRDALVQARRIVLKADSDIVIEAGGDVTIKGRKVKLNPPG